MFCVIYQWRLKPDKEEDFRSLWRKVTAEVYRENGSFGSRLHRVENCTTSDGTLWIAYAQWPDKGHWAAGTKALAAKLADAKSSAECVAGDVRILFQLELMDDLLKPTQFVPDAD